MLEICVVAGALQWALAVDRFTLAWNHSIEKVRWEEDYRREGRMLVLDAARVRGSAAGMEPPPGAVLRDGAWHYRPALPPLPRVVLANSSYGGSYELCTAEGCRKLPPASPTIIEPCPAR
ncbi:MAG TPA: DUF1850 domain-containing protein [Burkholderiales bacterium]